MASQLERSLQDIVEKTIQKYRTNPEETAAEESWDYVQFQVSPLLQLPPRLTRLSPELRGDSTPTWPRPPALGPERTPTPPRPNAPHSPDDTTGPGMAQSPSTQTLAWLRHLPWETPPPPRPRPDRR